jgi:hypothetical protein
MLFTRDVCKTKIGSTLIVEVINIGLPYNIIASTGLG